MSQFSHSRQVIVLQTRDYPVYNFWPVEPVRAGHRRISPQKRRNFGLELLLADPATTPHEGGVLVIDDSGDRKDGTKTAHVGLWGARTAQSI
jgi:hypothetical protein